MTGTPQPTSPTRSSLTRQVIVEAARQRVSESGLDSLSLRRLAGDLGVTAPALYAHVRDKSDLLAQLADVGFRELAERYREIDTDDPIERLRQQCLIYTDLAVANPGLFQVMFHFRPGELDVPGPALELPSASEAFTAPNRAIREAIARGMIHPDHDPVITGLTLWTVAHGLAGLMMLGVHRVDPDRRRLADSVLGATLRGLRLPPD